MYDVQVSWRTPEGKHENTMLVIPSLRLIFQQWTSHNKIKPQALLELSSLGHSYLLLTDPLLHNCTGQTPLWAFQPFHLFLYPRNGTAVLSSFKRCFVVWVFFFFNISISHGRLFSVSFVALIMPCFFSAVCPKDMLWGLWEARGAHSSLQHLAKSVLVSLNLLALVDVYNAPVSHKQERCWAEVFGSYGVCAMNRLCVHTLFGGELPFLCLISVE